MYQNVRLQIHRERASKNSGLFAHIIREWPLTKIRLINKHAKHLKNSHLNYFFDASSQRRCSIEKISSKLLQINEKTSVLKPLFNKTAGHWPATLLKRDFNTRTPSLQKTSGRMLLKNFVFNSLALVIGLIHNRYIISDTVYIKKTAHEILFSQVCKINYQCNVFSRYRINH